MLLVGSEDRDHHLTVVQNLRNEHKHMEAELDKHELQINVNINKPVEMSIVGSYSPLSM